MLVSVIIPTFNRSKKLKRALESVISQTYPHKELIVIDDGSTDDTKEILKNFSEASYFWQENRGVSAARNLGIEKARAKWIAFLDSDDSWQRDKLEKQIQALQEASEYKICHTDETWIRDGKEISQKKNTKKAVAGSFKIAFPCAQFLLQVL